MAVQTLHAKKKRPMKFRRSSRRRGLSSIIYIIERSFLTGRIYSTMHQPARTNRSHTGTPGANRTQALAGGHMNNSTFFFSFESTQVARQLLSYIRNAHMIKFVSSYLQTNTYACLVSFLVFRLIAYFPVQTLKF